MLGATPREFESRILRFDRSGRSQPAARAVARRRQPGPRRREVALTSPARRQHDGGRQAVLLLAGSVALMILVGALGTSAAVLPLSPRPAPGGPPAALVTFLLAMATLLGAAGLAAGWRALAVGWSPDPKRMLAAGVLATGGLLVVPPMATADIGSYAAYGRMVVRGADPYVTTPADLPHDPVAGAAEAPWLGTPSVYGPLATGEQALVAEVGGASRAAVLRGLAVLAGGAFLATGFLLDRVAARGRPGRPRHPRHPPRHPRHPRHPRSETAGRRRTAALLWTCNPLLLLQLVAAGHVDGLLCLLAVGGVLLAASRPVLGGALLGLAGSVKATAAIPTLGALAGSRDRRRARPLAGAALAVVAAGYALAGGWHTLAPARQASRSVSRGTPWRWIASGLERLLPHATARDVVVYGAAALAVLVALLLARRLPAGPAPLVRSAFLAVLAWTLVAPYALPWYDALAWCLLGALVATGEAGPAERLLPFAAVLAVHTAILTIGYLPGRSVPLGQPLQAAMDGVRSGLCPVVVTACAVAACLPSWHQLWQRAGRRARPEPGGQGMAPTHPAQRHIARPSP